MEPKTIRKMFEIYYETLISLYQQYGAKIDAVAANSLLSPEGKKLEAAKIRNDLSAYLGKIQEQATTRVMGVVDRINNEEEAALAAKSNNLEYMALLDHTLSVLPRAIQDCTDLNALKDRLKPFSDDPIAIGALTAALKPTSKDDVASRPLMINDVLPEDHRGERQGLVTRVLNTFLTHCDQVSERMTLTSGNSFDKALPATMESALDFVKTLSDECTEIVAEDPGDRERESEGGSFDFGFKGVRPRS